MAESRYSKGSGQKRRKYLPESAEIGAEGKETLLTRIQDSNALLLLFALAFIGYLLTKSVILAIASGAFLISIFVLDILAGASQHGIRNEVWELLKAVVVALLIWVAINIILGTNAPISAIVSCSLLPAYERGDMIILRGVPIAEMESQINAPTMEINWTDFAAVYRKSHVPCGVMGPLTYGCESKCQRISSTTKQLLNSSVTCARSVTIKGALIPENLSNDVIVYAPSIQGRYVQGDIIHRVVAKLKVKDSNGVNEKLYLLTKGDNNDFFDATVFDIIAAEDVKGKVAMRIPILGYLKLFISGYFEDQPGCDTILLH